MGPFQLKEKRLVSNSKFGLDNQSDILESKWFVVCGHMTVLRHEKREMDAHRK